MFTKIKNLLSQKNGLTVVELLIVMGIIGVLSAFTTVNLLGLQHHASINSSVDSLVADLRAQQLKAMNGDTENVSPNVTGIYFGTNTQYTLFRGLNYSAGNSNNFSVALDSVLRVTTTLPGSKIVFASVSGEVVNYALNQDTVTIRDSLSTEQKVIKFNRYGTIISVN